MSKIDWNLLRNGARRANDPQYQDVFDKQFKMYEEIKELRTQIERLQQDAKYYRELLKAAKVATWLLKEKPE